MEHYLWYAHKKALKYLIHSAVCNLYEVFLLFLFFILVFLVLKLSAEYEKLNEIKKKEEIHKSIINLQGARREKK